jgi:hypothetical protein
MSIRTPTYRYVANESGKDELYNLNNDPQQETNVAGQYPEITSKLEIKTNDILSEIEASNLGIRPILIGQQQASYHELFADRAEFTGNIEFFKGFGYNSDWITSWNSLEDKIWWDIKALRTQTYDVYVRYTCEEKNVGSKIKVISNNTQITGTIDKVYDPPFIDVPDRVEAQGKSSLRKTWDTLGLGTLTIKKGSDELLLKAIDIKNETVCDIRSIILRKQ